MLTVSIKFIDIYSVREQIDLALIKKADAIELRLDYSKEIDLKAIKSILDDYRMPMIFTLRKKSQGGHYQYSETRRLNDLLSLAKLKPDYIDIEYDIPHTFVEKLSHYSKCICSYHCYTGVPADLDVILQSMYHPKFYAYKIAAQMHSTKDALRMMLFALKNTDKYLLTVIGMGEHGSCTRILSPVIGNLMHYSSISQGDTTASGQIAIDMLTDIYFIKRLNKYTRIYALLGDPVSSSVGHILHNQAISILNVNAVYIKLQVNSEDLPILIEFFHLLPFYGFSVTMPLKERIVAQLDDVDAKASAIKAVNTIVVKNRKLVGCNTDGTGAVSALKNGVNLDSRSITILGAGGAARAIAYEAIQHNAKVTILHRDKYKAEKLANELGCRGGSLQSVSGYKSEMIINTLPAHAYDRNILPANALQLPLYAMDIVYQPIETAFIELAQAAGCCCIYGYNMFINQALLQVETWFDLTPTLRKQIKQNMEAFFA